MHEPNQLCEILTPDFIFTDTRGTICQLVHDGYQQVNLVYTNKGSQRGSFHYHKINEELFFVIYGKIEVCLRAQDLEEKHVFGKGDMFQIHKNVQHDFCFLEDTLLLGLYDHGVELPDNSKDIYNA